MTEIREIKMVEQTTVKFVADDGTEFVGEGAKGECEAYERTRNKSKVDQAFKRLDAVVLKMPFVDWWSDDYEFWKIILNSKSDYVAMMDYFNVVWGVYCNYLEEPSAYPYTMIVSASEGCVNEYKRDLKEELQQALTMLG